MCLPTIKALVFCDNLKESSPVQLMVVSMSEVPSTPFKNWERVPGDSDADADDDSNADSNDIVWPDTDADANIDAWC